MATEGKDAKQSRVVAIAIDNSDYAEKAFDCEYRVYKFNLVIFYVLYIFIDVLVSANILKQKKFSIKWKILDFISLEVS
jgi:hypothetical protein